MRKNDGDGATNHASCSQYAKMIVDGIAYSPLILPTDEC